MLYWCRGSGAGAVHSLVSGGGPEQTSVTGADVVSPGHREEPRNLLDARVIPCTAEDYMLCHCCGVVVVDV